MPHDVLLVGEYGSADMIMKPPKLKVDVCSTLVGSDTLPVRCNHQHASVITGSAGIPI